MNLGTCVECQGYAGVIVLSDGEIVPLKWCKTCHEEVLKQCISCNEDTRIDGLFGYCLDCYPVLHRGRQAWINAVYGDDDLPF